MKSIIIGESDSGQRLDKYLKKYLRRAAPSFIYKMLRKKNIKLNNKKATGSELLSANDEITLYFSDEAIEGFRDSSDIKISLSGVAPIERERIVYEDENILIADKLRGELSQKARPDDISINEKILRYLSDTGKWSAEDVFTPGICNRLDRNTSGLIICGKTLIGTQTVSELIKKREIKKLYLALAEGKFTDDGWVRLSSYLEKNNKTNIVTISDTQSEDNKRSHIITAYRRLSEEEGGTLLEVELITGKTHQIRAQLSGIGHPLSGDIKYGGKKREGGYFLRAYRLIFPTDVRLGALSGREIITDKLMGYSQNSSQGG